MKERKTIRPCKAMKQDRNGCRAPALLESHFCYFHDPLKAGERREAQASGGLRNRIQSLGVTAPDVTVADCGDVVALIAQTINQVRKGFVDPRIANSVGYLANVLIKAFEQDKLETRIERLEALFEHRSEQSELVVTGMRK
jgi:hypothetical protein